MPDVNEPSQESVADEPVADEPVAAKSEATGSFDAASLPPDDSTAAAPAIESADAAEAGLFEPAAFTEPAVNGHAAESLGPLALLQDVDMEVTVELGRTTMPIRELLALQPGMVVELDRVAGAPIDVLVNGRRFACGEVVVIDEEFGLRITEIVGAS